jgi:hypothetical protein
MANQLRDSAGNAAAVKDLLIKHRQAGEKVISAEFKATFEGYPELTLLITNCQMPAYRRALVEGFGPLGTKSNQQGPIENAGEFPAQLVQPIKGKTLTKLREMVRNKVYIPTITVAMTPESAGAKAVDGCVLEECWISIDAIDFANDSVTEITKLPLTINYTWSESLKETA